MPDANDMDLVREFARHNSEAAFTELVRRHINLVYSVALRCTGDTGDAQDVTQGRLHHSRPQSRRPARAHPAHRLAI